MNTKLKRWSGVMFAVLAVAGCEDGPKSGRGFRLPDGNAEQGKAAFVKLQCNSCHQVVGVEMPAPETKGHLNVFIGGEVTRLRSYGELVTSVINPSHGLAEGFDRKQMEKFVSCVSLILGLNILGNSRLEPGMATIANGV